MRKSILVSMLAAAALASVASADWSDGFETYADGPLSDGGWSGWDGNPAAYGTVTSSFAHTGNKSIQIGGAADAIHPFAGEYTSGMWTMTAWMLMFETDHTADTYFIVNNEYNDGGPYTWSIEMQFDVTTGTVMDDFRPYTPIAIAYDRWAEITIEFDLDNNVQTSYYDGQFLSTGTIPQVPGDPLEIANIDLFTTGATSYFDDIAITPAPGAAGLLLLGVGGLVRRRRR